MFACQFNLSKNLSSYIYLLRGQEELEIDNVLCIYVYMYVSKIYIYIYMHKLTIYIYILSFVQINHHHVLWTTTSSEGQVFRTLEYQNTTFSREKIVVEI